MMTKEQLNDRIENKNIDIQKINNRIIKWSKTCTDEDIAIAKEYGMTDYNSSQKQELRNKYSEYKKQQGYDYHHSSDIDEVMRAYGDLREAQKTLEKYQVQLSEITNFENEDKIEVLVEFLKQWRAQAYDWYIKNTQLYMELKDKFKEKFETFKEQEETRLNTELSWREAYYLEGRFASTYYSMINALSKDIAGYNKTINTDKLNKVLDDEVVAKYKDLVLRITSVVGEILDVSNLSIGEKNGEINGTVKGTNGVAKIETISAGGYNQNQIVNVKHGQIFHYRVLVHKLKNYENK